MQIKIANIVAFNKVKIKEIILAQNFLTVMIKTLSYFSHPTHESVSCSLRQLLH